MQQEAAEAQREFTPIFEEVAEMSQEQAINVLIQCAGLAQQSGKLNIRDSVMLAKSISILSPGSL